MLLSKKNIIILTLLLQVFNCVAQRPRKDTVEYFKNGKVKFQIIGDTSRELNQAGKIIIEKIIRKNGDIFITKYESRMRLRYEDTILKTEITDFKKYKNDLWTIYYSNGNYETGNAGKYFSGYYRKNKWRKYNKDGKLIATGKYKKFILIRRPFCGNGIEPDIRQGKWTFYNAEGQVTKIEDYNKRQPTFEETDE
jgi:hypothetical protein